MFWYSQVNCQLAQTFIKYVSIWIGDMIPNTLRKIVVSLYITYNFYEFGPCCNIDADFGIFEPLSGSKIGLTIANLSVIKKSDIIAVSNDQTSIAFGVNFSYKCLIFHCLEKQYFLHIANQLYFHNSLSARLSSLEV